MPNVQPEQPRPSLTPEQRRILAQVIDVLLADRAERKGTQESKPKKEMLDHDSR